MEQNAHDIYAVVKIEVVTDVKVNFFSYTRADVLTKLMEFAAEAAAVFGPYSDEVWDLESDIEEVKNGAALADFGWCFPQMDEFVKAEVA
jgi:hypothetical protein